MIVAVLSDIHSNLVALDAVLDSIASLGPVDAVWHLGDVVGYGPEPDAVVDRLREIGAVGVKGNHDDAACGGASIGDFNPVARLAAEWTRDRIRASTRHFLESLPLILTPAEMPFTLVHGSPRDPIYEYVLSPRTAELNLAAFSTPHCLFGHTHVPIVFRENRAGRENRGGHAGMDVLAPEPGAALRLDDRRCLINPGSVGQPRDGDPDASYAILDTGAGAVTWHRVTYDVGATQAAILTAGLPPALASRLAFGM